MTTVQNQDNNSLSDTAENLAEDQNKVESAEEEIISWELLSQVYDKISNLPSNEDSNIFLTNLILSEKWSANLSYYLLILAYRKEKWGLLANLLQNVDMLLIASNNEFIPLLACRNQWQLVELLTRDLNSLTSDAEDQNITLQQACLNGKYEIVKRIILNTAVRDNMFVRKWLALRLAAENNHHNIVCLLVTSYILPKCGYTPLMLTLNTNNFSQARLMIAALDPQALNAHSEYGFTALMLAAAKYMLPSTTVSEKMQLKLIILDLLDAKVDITVTNNNYNFPFLASLSDLLDCQQIVAKLIEKYSTAEFKKQHEGKNLLHAFIQCQARISKPLLESLVNNLNDLDNHGNSPLSYTLFSPFNRQSNDYILNMLNRNARFLRYGAQNEIKSPIHLAVLSANDDETGQRILCEMLTDRSLCARLNDQDENGLTALHYAIMSKKSNIADLLQKSGAKDNIKDHHPGFTAKDYLELQNPDFNSEFSASILGPVWSAIKYLLEEADKNTISNLNMALNIIGPNVGADYQLELMQIGWLKAICKKHTPESFTEFAAKCDTLARQILDTQFNSLPKYAKITFPVGFALGIELEIPELRTNMPINEEDLKAWFNIGIVKDFSVNRSMLSPNLPITPEQINPEITSPILSTKFEYNKFLGLAALLQKLGARVNATAGLHVHVNCRGDGKELPRFIPEDKEFIYLKYLLKNYISLEMLLLGFMREGAAFARDNGTYITPISSLREQIDQCSSVEELQKICTHDTSIDLTALDKHGTVEFRFHEGAIDPILIHAWVDCISRIVMTSVDQAHKHTETSMFEQQTNIENLLYILITMRDYAKTWDPQWGATKTADIAPTTAYPGKDSRPHQLQIQTSTEYTLLRLIIDGKTDELMNYFIQGSFVIEDLNALLIQMENLLESLIVNPGVFQQNISQIQIRQQLKTFQDGITNKIKIS